MAIVALVAKHKADEFIIHHFQHGPWNGSDWLLMLAHSPTPQEWA
ncbi:MAG: hypothetical protein VKK80_08040 [Prochlorothrix sp.]|nr:hypothetical protein [Prochlorothrix sp.]